MKRTLVVTLEAEAEIAQAADWYLRQSWRAANGFRENIDAALDAIKRNPEQYQVVYRQTRRVLLETYPYALFYVVTSAEVTVISCFHTSRNQNLWR